MSWFRNKSSSSDKARKRAIQSLTAKSGGLFTLLQQDRNSYKVVFRTRMGENSFTIALSEQFPDVAPRLFYDAKYSHPLLDHNGNIVGLDELNRWNANSDLGIIVNKAVMQFVASPPTLKQMASSTYKPVAKLASAASPPSYQQHQNMKKQQSMLDMRSIKFSIPQKIDKLDELSTEQIDEIVKEPKLIEEFAYSVAAGLREMREQQQTEILRIANANLTKKEEISKTDKEIQALRQEIDTLTAYYSDLKQRQEKQQEKFSKQRLNIELNKEIAKSDEKTNEIKDKFDEGDIAPVAFIKKYVKERKHYHLLQIKKEKLNLFQ